LGKRLAVIVLLPSGRQQQGKEGIMPDVGGIAGAQLKSFIERIERLEDEKRAIGEDIKEVYALTRPRWIVAKLRKTINSE
jgi:uncharacterized protein (UPF0335 family)